MVPGAKGKGSGRVESNRTLDSWVPSLQIESSARSEMSTSTLISAGVGSSRGKGLRVRIAVFIA
jgi:hypothetical protein